MCFKLCGIAKLAVGEMKKQADITKRWAILESCISMVTLTFGVGGNEPSGWQNLFSLECEFETCR